MIRQATEGDLARLMYLATEMHRESRFRDWPFDEGKMSRLLLGLIQNGNGDCFAWVAETEGDVVGGLIGQVYEMWFSTQKVASDYGLFMLPQHRGGAAAARLVKQFKGWAQAQDAICEMGCNTGINPEMYDRFMAAMGFREVAKIYAARR